MGQVITAPEVWAHGHQPGLFLAGGISNCPDWQGPVAKRIAENTLLDVINPRRENWNIEGLDEESIAQIRWEYAKIHKCDYMLFWFCEETLCPITLYELGMAVSRQEVYKGPGDIRLMVGVHPNYARKLDVITQVGLARPEIKVYQDLDVMVDKFIENFEWP